MTHEIHAKCKPCDKAGLTKLIRTEEQGQHHLLLVHEIKVQTPAHAWSFLINLSHHKRLKR